MSWSVTVLRVKGIDIKIHASFGLIFIWAAYYWGSRADTAVEGALFGVIATLLLFAAVVMHELAHSLEAMRFGIRVHDITLYPIGGVARMEAMPSNPWQELRIAVAGPLSNIVLAMLLGGVGWLLDWRAVISLNDLYDSVGDTTWSGMLAYLTMANLLLALFNLLPAFPLDGGRVFRALLATRMDYLRATQIAVAVGQGMALVLGFLGFTSGSWSLILIAIFIWFAGAQEGKHVEVKRVLRDVTAGQAMTRRPHALAPDDSLAQAADLLLSTAQTAFPVLDHSDDQLVGLLGEDDLLKGLRGHPATARVRDVMRTDIPTTTAAAPLFEALRQMAASQATAMVVVDATGAVIGLLTAQGINEAYRLLMVSPSIVQSGDASSGTGQTRPAVAS
jgi:Zn-dependent protease/CBS domain-containing protein